MGASRKRFRKEPEARRSMQTTPRVGRGTENHRSEHPLLTKTRTRSWRNILVLMQVDSSNSKVSRRGFCVHLFFFFFFLQNRSLLLPPPGPPGQRTKVGEKARVEPKRGVEEGREFPRHSRVLTQTGPLKLSSSGLLCARNPDL